MARRLADTLSPYLQQHADNPVDWYPWGQQALEAARASDRPILLSIGYSACHWCHVMAHESFEDNDIARRMNAWFVNIKVDREERPDLDRVHQLAHQVLTGRGGGWPLTMFLDPLDLTPFAAGTYFPPEARNGLIGFGELLERVHSAWLERRDELRAQNGQLKQALARIGQQRAPESADYDDLADRMLASLEACFDERHGGFDRAPRFPRAPLLESLLERSDSDDNAARMLADTLHSIVRHGLFDHLGGGFFRYCVDDAWEIPHFEKMLTDNALLLPILAEAARKWSDSELSRAAERTGEFLLDDMMLPDGGLATSLDADSLPDAPDATAPEEGAFYLWRRPRFDASLAPELVELARARWGLDGPANFHGRSWHLVAARGLDELTEPGRDATATLVLLEQAREQLLACRRGRPAPARDDKMLAGPNALAALGLARAGRALVRPEWIKAASRLIELIRERQFSDRPAHAVWRDGRAGHPALLDDYAALLLAELELLMHHWDGERLHDSIALADEMLERFHDAARQTFYLTPRDHEALLIRPTATADEATPAGAALALRGLDRLAHLTGDARLNRRIDDALTGAAAEASNAPDAHAALIGAGLARARPGPSVLIGGPGSEPAEWHARLLARPGLRVYRIPPGDSDLPGPLAEVAAFEDAGAIVCVGHQCLAPARGEAALNARIEEAFDAMLARDRDRGEVV